MIIIFTDFVLVRYTIKSKGIPVWNSIEWGVQEHYTKYEVQWRHRHKEQTS